MKFNKIATDKFDEVVDKFENPEKYKPTLPSKFREYVKQTEITESDSFSVELLEPKEQIIVQDEINEELFDGYFGELNSAPNPLECGPNAMYRNVNEGKVYKKSKDNLWEVFLQDGKQGQSRNQIIGSGVGVEEVKRIFNETSNYVGSFNSLSALPLTAIPGQFATTKDGKLYVWSE